VALIRINEAISIDERDLEERFIRAPGPGGQNVNKLASAVQLRFDVRGASSLPEEVRERLARLAGRRLTREGVLVISAQRHRTQERNRADAREPPDRAHFPRSGCTVAAPRRRPARNGTLGSFHSSTKTRVPSCTRR
jgi:ribosome-associated protein